MILPFLFGTLNSLRPLRTRHQPVTSFLILDRWVSSLTTGLPSLELRINANCGISHFPLKAYTINPQITKTTCGISFDPRAFFFAG